jgi:DNA repair protein RadA
MAINAHVPPEEGGLGENVFFIDTEDTFRPNRIDGMIRGLSDEKRQALMVSKGVEGDIDSEDVMDEVVERVLEDIKVAKAFNSDHQMLLCEQALEDAREMEDDVGLLIVDSLTAHFRAEYVGRGELAERQQKLNKHLADVSSFADMLNAGVIITNQVASNPDSYFGDPTQPIGGNILGHSSTVRLYIRNSKANKRIMKLVDSPDLPEGEAVFRITTDGIEDE